MLQSTDDVNLKMFSFHASRFIEASRSPNGKPMLVVCGSVSGTVAFLEVTDVKNNENGDNTNDDSSATHLKLHTSLLTVAFLLFYLITNTFRWNE